MIERESERERERERESGVGSNGSAETERDSLVSCLCTIALIHQLILKSEWGNQSERV